MFTSKKAIFKPPKAIRCIHSCTPAKSAHLVECQGQFNPSLLRCAVDAGMNNVQKQCNGSTTLLAGAFATKVVYLPAQHRSPHQAAAASSSTYVTATADTWQHVGTVLVNLERVTVVPGMLCTPQGWCACLLSSVWPAGPAGAAWLCPQHQV
jgi:hypothetical protein